MQDFPSNSRKAAQARNEEPKKLERVTSAEAVRRKRGLGRQFRETFIGGDAKTAAEYMMLEVVVPAIKDTVAEALQSGIEKLIYGDSRPRRGPSSSSNSGLGHFNYQGIASGSRTPPTSRSQSGTILSRRSRAQHNFDEIVLQSRQEALDVLDQMYEILSRYGQVSVADLYILTGIRSEHTDYKWGWISLRGAQVRTLRGGGGYLLDLPEPTPLS